jgi:hypothetical protein
VAGGGRSSQEAPPAAGPGAKALPAGVLARIRATFPSLSDAEQRVAEAILARPREAVFLPVKELAQRAGASEATIVRCCRSLGYSGLRELKLALAAETLTAPQQVIHETIQPGDSILTVARKVLRSDQEAIADTLAVLDEAALEGAVAALLRATRVEFYGIGSSMPVALDAYYRFARLAASRRRRLRHLPHRAHPRDPGRPAEGPRRRGHLHPAQQLRQHPPQPAGGHRPGHRLPGDLLPHRSPGQPAGPPRPARRPLRRRRHPAPGRGRAGPRPHGRHHRRAPPLLRGAAHR